MREIWIFEILSVKKLAKLSAREEPRVEVCNGEEDIHRPHHDCHQNCRTPAYVYPSWYRPWLQLVQSWMHVCFYALHTIVIGCRQKNMLQCTVPWDNTTLIVLAIKLILHLTQTICLMHLIFISIFFLLATYGCAFVSKLHLWNRTRFLHTVHSLYSTDHRLQIN